MLQIFGIRHHGSGSTRRLQKALAAYAPDLLVLEGVEECDQLVQHLRRAAAHFAPPVAALIYNPKDFSQAVYYPFAEFSPEWQAMCYAIAENVPIVHFDLPQSARFALEQQARDAVELHGAAPENHASAGEENRPKRSALSADPLGYMAQLAGYSDGEQWWEVMFEQQTEEELFVHIGEMMRHLREHIPQEEERPIDLLREAYMRQKLRALQKEGYQRIAVVCGAYHVPALDLDKHKAKDETALLKTIPKAKLNLQSAWIPWTYQRLSTSSGYGAGVQAPAYYHFLFQNPQDAAIQWLTRVAIALREQDIDCSSAHVIEAVRLSQALSQMRGLALPTLQEMNEATVSVLLGGDAEKLQLLQQRLIVGDLMGSLPEDLPQLPIQQDFQQQLKDLRLGKYLTETGWIKKTAAAPQGGLDLREEHDRRQSQFLHRLLLLAIPFGKESANTGRELSNKNEYWQMQWLPEYALLLIESSIWGSSIEQAASEIAINKARHAEELRQLAELLQRTLKANLPRAFDLILQYTQELAALGHEAAALLGMLPALVQVARYGDVRGTNTSLVRGLIAEIAPRACVLLPNACLSLQYEAAQKLKAQIVEAHRALYLHQDTDIIKSWAETLALIAQNSSTAAPLLKGVAARLLFDSGQNKLEDSALAMQFALSPAQRRQDAAQWVEGFLFSSGLLLIHNPALWRLVDDWVARLDEAALVEMLPLLRRTFSRFSQAERQKMLSRAQQTDTPKQADSQAAPQWQAERQERLRSLLLRSFSV